LKLKNQVGTQDAVLRHKLSQAWWYMPVIPALGRQSQEDHEFEVILGYTESSMKGKEIK
jgi:hypothetical protein